MALHHGKTLTGCRVHWSVEVRRLGERLLMHPRRVPEDVVPDVLADVRADD
jgi:hypothetical protein